MDERKYEVVDPDSSKYKLTADDIKAEKKQMKKRRKGLRVLIALLLIFAIIAGGSAAFINSYLSKINYGDMQAEINPEADKNEAVSFEGQDTADDDIRKNLSDKNIWYDDRVYNILLVGYDLGDMAKAYFPRSDSMILLSVNSVTNTINMVSLSRAAYVSIEGHGNKRLNAAHAYGGAAKLVETIQNNYKIRIDKYITVDFAGFTNIIDILGGVDINLTATEAANVVGQSVADVYHLNGSQALQYSRLRSIDSDRARTGRQRTVITALIDKAKTSSVTTLAGLMDDVLPYVTTNFSKTELIGQVTKAGTYLKMTIKQDIIPHNAVSLTTIDGAEVLILNWAETNKYTHDLLYPDMVPQSSKDYGEVE